jgi:hydrogenase maturation protein HypF
MMLTATLAPPPTRHTSRVRGVVPQPIKLPRAGPSVLATGAGLKNSVCVTRGDQAFLSPPIGDLDNADNCAALVEAVGHLCQALDVQPTVVAHDKHPDFFSTRFANAYAAEHQVPTLAVQHHHAHVAAVAAEHGVLVPLLGLALDGVGLGDDNGAWGGELLCVDGANSQRQGHLRHIALPGGDAAAREPWRMAAAALAMLGRGEEAARRFGHHAAAGAVVQLLKSSKFCPPTSSTGRWFDAAAALLGVCEVNNFEGQAAMQLEALASPQLDADEPLSRWMPLSADGGLDPTPLIAALADERDAARGATLFHHALADGLARWVGQAAQLTGLRQVALGGGCFLNALLRQLLTPKLTALGLQVLQAKQAPPNDAGVALGQAWVALCASPPPTGAAG